METTMTDPWPLALLPFTTKCRPSLWLRLFSLPLFVYIVLVLCVKHFL